MLVEDGEIKYSIENRLVKKMDILIERVTRPNQKQNSFLENHGMPGEGKTNSSVVEAHYVKWKTGRPISMFFRLEKLIDFLKTTENQIVIWDEPSLNSLSTDQLARINRDLLRLINTMRKKRHFIIVNFTKFWRFPEDIVVDTCLGMVHHNSKNGTDPGRFVYIRHRNLEALWDIHRKTGKKAYGKLKSFGGRMPHILEKYFHLMDITIEGQPHCTYDDYERLKDAAIESIGGGTEKKSKKEIELERKLADLRFKIANLPDYEKEKLASHLGVSSGRLREWRKRGLNTPNTQENEVFEALPPPSTFSTRAIEIENDVPAPKEGQRRSIIAPLSPS